MVTVHKLLGMKVGNPFPLHHVEVRHQQFYETEQRVSRKYEVNSTDKLQRETVTDMIRTCAKSDTIKNSNIGIPYVTCISPH
ncbi:hypothetical protein J6590_092377 [Homalodisca vitripennis]|nr:hypothetical protein J6590_092377 [Homalodisca vitripennis]